MENRQIKSPIMTAPELGELLRIGSQTINRWAKDGLLPDAAYVQLPSGGYRYFRSWWHEYLHMEKP